MTLYMILSSLFVYIACLLITVKTLCLLAHDNASYTNYSLSIPLYEYDALEDFYFATNGLYWNYSSFNEAHWDFTGKYDPCSEGWQGIECRCIEVSSML